MAAAYIFGSRVAQTLNNVLVSYSFSSACRNNSAICPGSVASPRLSHHLSSWHGFLLVSGIPVSKIVHISSWVHRCTFGSHADIPQGTRRGGGWWWRGKVFSLGSTGPVLHDLLVFRSFILEPYFHLEKEKSTKSTRVKSHTGNTVVGFSDLL